MVANKVKRTRLVELGVSVLGQIESGDVGIREWKSWLMTYQFHTECPDDDFGWLACVLALAAVTSGNFGVGSVLVDCSRDIVAWGHNQVFSPYFRSDRHAEMVVVDRYEKLYRNATKPKAHTLYTSLEPCPMCLARASSFRPEHRGI